jgi:hypothetical protein
MERRTKGAIADDLTVATYRLISVDRTGAPSGATGDDWLVYRISQGANVVTGYRRGRRQDVRIALEDLVEALNVRLLVKGRPYGVSRFPPLPPQHKDLT